MAILSYLAGVTARSLCLAAAALLGIWLFRVKTAPARHAVLTVVTAGMLLLAVVTPILPPLPVRVLQAERTAEPAGAAGITSIDEVARKALWSARPDAEPRSGEPAGLPRLDWRKAAAGVYLAVAVIFLVRLAFGYVLTRRLVRASHSHGDLYESGWIVAPMTVGWLRPKILLPAGWKEWEPAKLEAVLAHERMHIRRADWAITALAAFNRSVFWFNPLAWWLERRLGVLAEQACDDAAVLATDARDRYAEALLEIAIAVRATRGRLNWEAMAMARPSEVRERIERILDVTRQVPRGPTRGQWAALASCGLATACLAAALQLVPARAQQQTTPDLTAQMMRWRMARLSPEEVDRLERTVAQHPEDVAARTRLIVDYLVTGNNGPRASHVLWMIEHYPEAEVHEFPALFGGAGPLQDLPAYTRAAELWRRQAAIRASDPRVALNAARFFAIYLFPYTHDLYEAEQWLKRARELDPGNHYWAQRLATCYSGALWDVAKGESWANPSLGEHARAELDSSSDGSLIWQAGAILANSGPAQNPQLAELNEYGRQLQKRAKERLGYRPYSPSDEEIARDRAIREEAFAGPQPIRRVDPVYPPAASQARIQGSVRLRVLISRAGRVMQTEVVSGHSLLIKAAQDAVKQWVYAPQTMETLVEVEVPFRP